MQCQELVYWIRVLSRGIVKQRKLPGVFPQPNQSLLMENAQSKIEKGWFIRVLVVLSTSRGTQVQESVSYLEWEFYQFSVFLVAPETVEIKEFNYMLHIFTITYIINGVFSAFRWNSVTATSLSSGRHDDIHASKPFILILPTDALLERAGNSTLLNISRETWPCIFGGNDHCAVLLYILRTANSSPSPHGSAFRQKCASYTKPEAVACVTWEDRCKALVMWLVRLAWF